MSKYLKCYGCKRVRECKEDDKVMTICWHCQVPMVIVSEGLEVTV